MLIETVAQSRAGLTRGCVSGENNDIDCAVMSRLPKRLARDPLYSVSIDSPACSLAGNRQTKTRLVAVAGSRKYGKEFIGGAASFRHDATEFA